MKKLFVTGVLLAIVALLISSCSKKDTSGPLDQDPAKPQPQVRVMAIPSVTAVPTIPGVEISPTPESIATPGTVQYLIDPTPDVDAIADQIEGMLDDIDRRLNGNTFQLKP